MLPDFHSQFKLIDMIDEATTPATGPIITGTPKVPINAAVVNPAATRDTAPIPTSTPASPIILDVDSSFPSCRSG